MKLPAILPWIGAAIVLTGAIVFGDQAVLFFRFMLLAAVLFAMIGSINAARCFERGDQLFTTWSVLATGYGILAVRYVIRIFVTLNMMQTPVMFDRVLLVVHNIVVPVALYLFVRSWRTTGLAGPVSSGASLVWTLAGFIVAFSIGAFPIIKSVGNTDPAVLISTLGDVVSIAMIVPLLMPALSLRGGLLMYTWLYLAIAEIAWLAYDIWAVARPRIGISTAWGLAIDQAIRAVALLYIYAAATAQRRAIQQTEADTTQRMRRPVIAESQTVS
jgi:hypothetical protein